MVDGICLMVGLIGYAEQSEAHRIVTIRLDTEILKITIQINQTIYN